VTLEQRLKEIGGCGDGGCIVIRPVGMHTNGGCKCNRDYIKMSRVVRAYKEHVAVLYGRILDLEEQIGN
jgi:hypothetical protein